MTAVVFDDDYTIYPKVYADNFAALTEAEKEQSYYVTSIVEVPSSPFSLFFYDDRGVIPSSRHPVANIDMSLVKPYGFHDDEEYSAVVNSVNLAKFLGSSQAISHQNVSVIKGTMQDNYVEYGPDINDSAFFYWYELENIGTVGSSITAHRLFFADRTQSARPLNATDHRPYLCNDIGGPVYWQHAQSGEWYVTGLIYGVSKRFSMHFNGKSKGYTCSSLVATYDLETFESKSVFADKINSLIAKHK